MTDGLVLRGLSFDRLSSDTSFHLDQPELRLPAGSIVGLIGPSGCGKSTLLDILALILRPNAVAQFSLRDRNKGLVELSSLMLSGSADQLAMARANLIGYVLQTGGLLPFATVRENIALPRRILGMPDAEIVDNLASVLGIAELLDRWPDKLSVGQRQRVAVARAISHQPPLVIADEPTASLDPETADATLDLLVRSCREVGATLIVATHDRARASRFDMSILRFSSVNRSTTFYLEGKAA